VGVRYPDTRFESRRVGDEAWGAYIQGTFRAHSGHILILGVRVASLPGSGSQWATTSMRPLTPKQKLGTRGRGTTPSRTHTHPATDENLFLPSVTQVPSHGRRAKDTNGQYFPTENDPSAVPSIADRLDALLSANAEKPKTEGRRKQPLAPANLPYEPTNVNLNHTARRHDGLSSHPDGICGGMYNQNQLGSTRRGNVNTPGWDDSYGNTMGTLGRGFPLGDGNNNKNNTTLGRGDVLGNTLGRDDKLEHSQPSSGHGRDANHDLGREDASGDLVHALNSTRRRENNALGREDNHSLGSHTPRRGDLGPGPGMGPGMSPGMGPGMGPGMHGRGAGEELRWGESTTNQEQDAVAKYGRRARMPSAGRRHVGGALTLHKRHTPSSIGPVDITHMSHSVTHWARRRYANVSLSKSWLAF
jgi:hypothetical protein